MGEALYDVLGREASLWLLVLAKKGNVTNNAAANYSTYTGAIEAYAKEGGINLNKGEIRSGFKRLRRKKVELQSGASNTILVDDDRQDYIKLTNVGYTIQTELQTRPEVRESLRRELGMEVDSTGDKNAQLWPPEADSGAREIVIEVLSELPKDTSGSFEMEVEAKFECPRDWCDNTVEHHYAFVNPDEAYSETVQTECGQCSTKWQHKPGYAFESPDIVE